MYIYKYCHWGLSLLLLVRRPQYDSKKVTLNEVPKPDSVRNI